MKSFVSCTVQQILLRWPDQRGRKGHEMYHTWEKRGTQILCQKPTNVNDKALFGFSYRNPANRNQSRFLYAFTNREMCLLHTNMWCIGQLELQFNLSIYVYCYTFVKSSEMRGLFHLIYTFDTNCCYDVHHHHPHHPQQQKLQASSGIIVYCESSKFNLPIYFCTVLTTIYHYVYSDQFYTGSNHVFVF
jgi:hypothetical protein